MVANIPQVDTEQNACDAPPAKQRMQNLHRTKHQINQTADMDAVDREFFVPFATE